MALSSDKMVSYVAYKLDLPPSSRIYPTFHVSYLKKKTRTKTQPLSTLPVMNSHGEILPKPKAIVDRRMKKIGDKAMTEVLVQWLGTGEGDRSWENLRKLRGLYPHLVDNVI